MTFARAVVALSHAARDEGEGRSELLDRHARSGGAGRDLAEVACQVLVGQAAALHHGEQEVRGVGGVPELIAVGLQDGDEGARRGLRVGEAADGALRALAQDVQGLRGRDLRREDVVETTREGLGRYAELHSHPAQGFAEAVHVRARVVHHRRDPRQLLLKPPVLPDAKADRRGDGGGQPEHATPELRDAAPKPPQLVARGAQAPHQRRIVGEELHERAPGAYGSGSRHGFT